MDPLTHTAVGFTLAQTGMKRWTRSPFWVMFFAASAPDVDGLFFLPGDVNVLEWHRHVTHSFAFAPVLALLVVLGVKYVLRRAVDFRGAWALATVGVLSHCLVDLLTYRGARVLLPFNEKQLALQIEWFFDPVLMTLLVLGLGIPLLGRLVSQEIGAKPGSGSVAAVVCLTLALAWFGVRYSLREQALAEVGSRVYEGIAPERVDVFPLMNPLQFHGLADCGRFFKSLEMDLSQYFDPEEAQTYFRPVPSVEAGRALQVAGTTHSARVITAWARWPRWQVNRYDGETRWVVLIEELAVEPWKSRPRVIIRMSEKYEVLEERYEKARGASGF
jgi:membrane-bound metal-dependent hydrolase YbcI (DUF457 family)